MNGRSRIKDVLIVLGKVLCYLTLFLGWQMIVSTVYTVTIMTEMMLNSGGAEIDELAVAQALMAQVGEISLVSGFATLGSVALLFTVRKKPLYHELRLYPVSGRLFVWCGAAAFCLYWLVSLGLGFLPPAWLESYEQASSGIAQTDIQTIIATALVAPLVEEVIFRGLILTRLERVMPGWAAVVLSAVIFGACHGNFVWFCYAFALGLVFGWVARNSGSLLPSMLMHVTFNSTNEAMMLFNQELDMVVMLLLFAAATGGTALCAWRLIAHMPEPVRPAAAVPVEQERAVIYAPPPEAPGLPSWDPDSGMDHRFPADRM